MEDLSATICKLRAEPDVDRLCDAKFYVDSTVGGHNVGSSIATFGRMQCDLAVQYEVTGGWFNKRHYFKFHGTNGNMQKFLVGVRDLLKSYQ